MASNNDYSCDVSDASSSFDTKDSGSKSDGRLNKKNVKMLIPKIYRKILNLKKKIHGILNIDHVRKDCASYIEADFVLLQSVLYRTHSSFFLWDRIQKHWQLRESGIPELSKDNLFELHQAIFEMYMHTKMYLYELSLHRVIGFIDNRKKSVKRVHDAEVVDVALISFIINGLEARRNLTQDHFDEDTVHALSLSILVHDTSIEDPHEVQESLRKQAKYSETCTAQDRMYMWQFSDSVNYR